MADHGAGRGSDRPATLLGFVETHREGGATAYTDEHRAYLGAIYIATRRRRHARREEEGAEGIVALLQDVLGQIE